MGKSQIPINPDEIYNIGECYYFGIGKDKNLEKAIECYEKAAGLGNLDAMMKLGHIYSDSTLTKRLDYNTAIMWFKKAVYANVKYADEADEAIYKIGSDLNALGEKYLYGEGVKADNKKAVMYIKAAIKLGNCRKISSLTFIGGCGFLNEFTAGVDAARVDILIEKMQKEGEKVWRTSVIINILNEKGMLRGRMLNVKSFLDKIINKLIE